jgi:type IV pilus assembly protein PilC
MNYVQMWLFMTNKSEPLRQTSLLMLLAGGIGHGETLLQGLKAHELESRGDWATRVSHLRSLMEQGFSLSAALSMVKNLLPDQTLSAIRAAEATGTLPDVLIDESRRISQSIQTNSGSSLNLESMLLVICALASVMTCVVSFLMIFIIPKFKEIFYGFGIEFPVPTMALISVSDFLLSYWYIFLLPVTGCTCLLFWWLYTSSNQRYQHGYHRFAEHWPRYWVPGILRQLSLSAATSQPLSQALEYIMMDMPPGRASRCVSELRYRVTSGEDMITALRDTGLLRNRESAFLQSSLKTRHLDWGLRHLAESIERKRQRWARRLPTIVAPMILLAAGFCVLFVVVALFMPLIKLLNDLS